MLDNDMLITIFMRINLPDCYNKCYERDLRVEGNYRSRQTNKNVPLMQSHKTVLVTKGKLSVFPHL